jgi:predicted DNA-binding WGR domain protein
MAVCHAFRLSFASVRARLRALLFTTHSNLHYKEKIMLKRRFEFVDGKSLKFWEITVVDCRVTVNYKGIGTSGQSQLKTIHDAGEATRHAAKVTAAKVTAAKVKKGCAEVADV